MAVLDFPVSLPLPASIAFRLRHNTQTSTSPLTQSVQTVSFPGARWLATLSWSNLTVQDQRTIKVWLAQLRGQAGRFRLWDLVHPDPAGVGAVGTVMVSGADQVGVTLVTTGWPVSTAGLLLPGDYISVNDELKLVTTSASSNGAGAATITFEPPLRSSPPDAATVTLIKPTAIFRLADDEQDQMTVRPPYRADLTIECVESWA